MSFKDLLMLWGDLDFGARFQSTEVFEGTWNVGFHHECFHTANTKPLRDCLAFGMICSVHKKMRVSLGTLNVIMFSLDK